MPKYLSSIFRLIAAILSMTVFSSAMAMAAYVCPELGNSPPMDMMDMMEGKPCADMDRDKPVHCAEYQSGGELALEHLSAPPALTPPTIFLVIPAIAPVVPLFLMAFRPNAPLDPGSDPPYLRTQRLRI